MTTEDLRQLKKARQQEVHDQWLRDYDDRDRLARGMDRMRKFYRDSAEEFGLITRSRMKFHYPVEEVTKAAITAAHFGRLALCESRLVS